MWCSDRAYHGLCVLTGCVSSRIVCPRGLCVLTGWASSRGVYPHWGVYIIYTERYRRQTANIIRHYWCKAICTTKPARWLSGGWDCSVHGGKKSVYSTANTISALIRNGLPPKRTRIFSPLLRLKNVCHIERNDFAINNTRGASVHTPYISVQDRGAMGFSERYSCFMTTATIFYVRGSRQNRAMA